MNMRSVIGLVAATTVLLAMAVGCGTSPAHQASPTVSAKGCPSGMVSMNENGHIHCLAVKHSSPPSSSAGETLQYQANAHWPGSTNRAAQHYTDAVVRYMNRMGDGNLPKRPPLSFPLRWTAGLANGGGPSGSPILLWQLSLPVAYKHWTARQWQQAIDCLEVQEFTGGFAKASFGVLANSNGSLNQEFQLVAADGFTVRFMVGDTIPHNNVGITTPIPTYAMMWTPSGTLPGASMNVIWDEWTPPEPTYPQLISLAEAHATASLNDLKTSGQQLWTILHPSASPPSTTPSQTSTSVSASSPAGSQEPSTSANIAPSTSSLNSWLRATRGGLAKIDWSTAIKNWDISTPVLRGTQIPPKSVQVVDSQAFPVPGPFIIATVSTSPTQLRALSGAQFLTDISSISADVMDAPFPQQRLAYSQPQTIVAVRIGSRSIWWMNATPPSQQAAIVESDSLGTFVLGTIDAEQSPGSSWWALSAKDGTKSLSFLEGR